MEINLHAIKCVIYCLFYCLLLHRRSQKLKVARCEWCKKVINRGRKPKARVDFSENGLIREEIEANDSWACKLLENALTSKAVLLLKSVYIPCLGKKPVSVYLC